MTSNIKSWMPRHPVTVTSAGKMSYFAKANAIRAGVTNAAGALQGLDAPRISERISERIDPRIRIPYRISERIPSRIRGLGGDVPETTRIYGDVPETTRIDPRIRIAPRIIPDRDERMAYRRRVAKSLGDINAVTAGNVEGRFFNFDPETIEGAGTAVGNQSLPSSPMQSVDSFLDKLTNAVKRGIGVSEARAEDPDWVMFKEPTPLWHTGLVVLGLVSGGYLVYRAVKGKR